MTPFSEHFYTAPDGIRTYYRRYPAQGDSGKTPVLCLHGLTRTPPRQPRGRGELLWLG